MMTHDPGDRRSLAWELRVTGGNEAELLLPPGQPDNLGVRIRKSTTKDAWDIQLNQAKLPLEAESRYRLTFQARAGARRTVACGVARAHSRWDNLGLYQAIDLSGEWQTFEFEFVVVSADRNARILFDLGGAASTVELAAVALQQLPGGIAVEPDFAVQGYYPAHRSLPRVEREPDGPPRFSVVIPTHRRRAAVVRAVQAFAAQRFDAAFEVIVVVDGLADDSAAALRSLQTPFTLTVLEQPNSGAAAARNRGAAAARGDILLFLDDDMEPHPMLLAEHEYSYSRGAAAVLGHIPLHPQAARNFLTEGYRTFAVDRAARLSQTGAELTLQDLLTGQLSVPRRLFEALGGFDVAFTQGGTYGNEDVDFGHRFLAAGHKFEFNVYAISYHDYLIQPRHYLRQARQTGRADVVFARKHPSRAGGIFSPYTVSWLAPKLWRALAALRPFSAPFTAAVRALALAIVRREPVGPRTEAFFQAIFEIEYWRGVREAGGMPRLTRVRVLKLESSGEPGQLRKQLRLLEQCGFHFIDASGFLKFLNDGRSLPHLAVLITFDCCREDLPESTLAVLSEFGVPAVAFAVSSRLGESGLRSLSAHGVEIGAHARTHRPLSQVPDSDLAGEVAGSVADLANAGFPRPRLFAYPCGAWSIAARRAVREAGLQAAFTADAGCARPGQDPLLIPRIEILPGDSGWRLLRKVIAPRG
jgi:glycosyltransferase involved in cell wall biosynthesis/peptidoglycan/xylan/chitin deacetylase (PgdA/CDA1 family)